MRCAVRCPHSTLLTRSNHVLFHFVFGIAGLLLNSRRVNRHGHCRSTHTYSVSSFEERLSLLRGVCRFHARLRIMCVCFVHSHCLRRIDCKFISMLKINCFRHCEYIERGQRTICHLQRSTQTSFDD